MKDKNIEVKRKKGKDRRKERTRKKEEMGCGERQKDRERGEKGIMGKKTDSEKEREKET